MILILLSALLLTVSQVQSDSCNTEVCKKEAKRIEAALNTAVNPCDDFYEYSCGGWEKSHTLPNTSTELNALDILEDLLANQIKVLLEDPGTNSTNSESSSVKYAKYLYSNCIKEGSSADAMANLEKLLHFSNGWNIGRKIEINTDKIQMLTDVYNIGVQPLFTIDVVRQPSDSIHKIISIDSPTFVVGDKELKAPLDNVEVINAYRQYITNVGRSFCGSDCSLLETDVAELIDLESKLAQAKMSVEDKRNPDKTSNIIKFDDLSKKTKIDWIAKIFTPINYLMRLDYPFDKDQNALIYDPDYIYKAIEILQKVPERTFANFVGWQVVSRYAPYSDEKFRRYQNDFLKVVTGVQIMPMRWLPCYELVRSEIGMAVSRLYVEHHFSQDQQVMAARLVELVLSSYDELVYQNSWLGDSKAASISKLEHIRKNVGYPHWILDNKQLDEFFGLDRYLVADRLLDDSNYLLSLLRFKIMQLQLKFSFIGQLVDPEKNWPMDPAVVNARYNAPQNSITIPAGILQPPYFDADRPFYLNFGASGIVIGHEFTHSLDDQGSRFDEQGNFKSWWTKDTLQRFNDQCQCFRKEYSAIKDPITHLNLNGNNTVGENIADSGGVREAYHAFQTYKKLNPTPTLVPLPQYSAEQLFYLTYAQTWCTKISPEQLKLDIEYDPHSPAKYRVNIPLSFSDGFGKAFNCPSGSKMNPKTKCLLW